MNSKGHPIFGLTHGSLCVTSLPVGVAGTHTVPSLPLAPGFSPSHCCPGGKARSLIQLTGISRCKVDS